MRLPDQGLLSAAALVVLEAEAASPHAPWLRTRAQEYGPQIRNRLENGLAYSALDYLEALRWRAPALAAHIEAIGSVEVILAPASRAAAPTIESTDFGGAADAERAIQAITRLMRPVNYLGLPTLVVPAAQSTQGLPIGLQLIGRPLRRRDRDRPRRRVPEGDGPSPQDPETGMSAFVAIEDSIAERTAVTATFRIDGQPHAYGALSESARSRGCRSRFRATSDGLSAETNGRNRNPTVQSLA